MNIKQYQDNLKKEIENNKFHAGNGIDKKHYWLTPKDVYDKLNEEFKFDFDPAPYPKPDNFDGLTCEWGKSSYLNPPFGSIIHQGKKKGATAWVRKSIEEHKKGKDVVFVYPIDKWILMLLKEGAEVRNLGDIKWLATEDNSQGKGTGRHIACFILKSNKDNSQLQGSIDTQKILIDEVLKMIDKLFEETDVDGRKICFSLHDSDVYDLKEKIKQLQSQETKSSVVFANNSFKDSSPDNFIDEEIEFLRLLSYSENETRFKLIIEKIKQLQEKK
jgi:hypothetical protein